MTDELELRDLMVAIRLGWRRSVVLVGLGALLGLAAAAVLPPRFDSQVMLLVRTPPDPTGAITQRFGPLAEIAGGALGLGQTGSPIATEIALLQSRTLIGEVVDSLGLQLRVRRRDPRTFPAVERPVGRFRPKRIDLGGVQGTMVDREDAIDDAIRRFEVDELGGEVLGLRYRGRDSMTAAAFPNLVASRYLVRRTTVDRGLNQRKYEFLVAQADSTRRALRQALADLRQAQQGQGVLATEVSGRAEAEQIAVLQGQLATVRGEVLALDSLLRTIRLGDARALAGFPALLRSPAVNELVGEMARLQTERTRLLATQRDQSPAVRALASARDSLEAQLIPLARTYAAALDRQQRSLMDELGARRRAQGAVASAGEILVVRETQVKGLAQATLALETQLLESRLAALTEGGDVRVIDAAVPPRKVTFPRRGVSTVAGALLGLLIGLLWAIAPLARRSAEAPRPI